MSHNEGRLSAEVDEVTLEVVGAFIVAVVIAWSLSDDNSENSLMGSSVRGQFRDCGVGRQGGKGGGFSLASGTANPYKSH